MSELISHTARLVPYTRRPKHLPSYVTAYIYEPAADEIGGRLGNFLVVIEALVSGRASEEVVDLIIQTAGAKYYNDPADSTDPLTRFEAAIKQTNHELSEYVGRGNAAWIGKLSAIIAVQSGSELHVAQTGSAEAFLYRGKAISRISVTDTTRPATPSKTFGSIASGELEAGDKLLLATPAMVHQIPLKQLHSVITGVSPNAAIQEFSQLLEGAVTNRVAAIISEITTPELAALKVRPEEPDELELGNNETLAAAAVAAAAPIAQTTAETSRRAAELAAQSWQALKPHARRAGLAAADAARRGLSTRRGRLTAGAVAIAAIILILFSVWSSAGQAASAKQFAQYQALYTRYTTAQSETDKTVARANLASIQKELQKLPHVSVINHQLQNSPLPQGEPSSVNGFIAMVADSIDQLDGLMKINPTTIADLGSGSHPAYFESDGTHAYIIDDRKQNALTIVNLQTGAQTQSKADMSQLGDVKSTTLSAAGDGIFIMTAKPSVWFYRFSTDTVTEQTLAYDQWPPASGIASYGSNLYLLYGSVIYKNSKNASGYSPKTTYITGLNGATNLAVDGWIYTTSPAGLTRYLGPVAKQTVPIPANLGQLTDLVSVAGGDFVMATSPSTGRLILWSAKNGSVVFDKQIAVQTVKSLYAATYDQKSGKIFATADHRLISLTVTP